MTHASNYLESITRIAKAEKEFFTCAQDVNATDDDYEHAFNYFQEAKHDHLRRFGAEPTKRNGQWA